MLVHFSIHYVKPEYKSKLIESMNRFRSGMRRQPGHISSHILEDEHSGDLIGMALWKSREEWERGLDKTRDAVKDDPFDIWETKEPDVFVLNEVATEPDQLSRLTNLLPLKSLQRFGEASVTGLEKFLESPFKKS